MIPTIQSQNAVHAAANVPQLNIGLITGSLYEDSIAILSGAISAARQHNVNLVCFQGGQIGLGLNEESVYRLITPDYIDGLILWAGWLGQNASSEDMAHFSQLFSSIKTVSISQQFNDSPSVMIDNRHGIREVLTHLIRDHNRQRVAIVQGPGGHFESEERYQSYLETLTAQGIPVDPALVAPGVFAKESGVAAVNLLLDERQVMPDAIVTLDDYVAIGVIGELQRRGLRVPDDIAVTGFDNVPEAEVFSPPLTTVFQSGFDQGRQAMNLLVGWLAGDDIPKQTNLLTPLIIRRSCGCPDPILATSPLGAPERQNGQAVAENDNDLSATLATLLAEQFPGVGSGWLPTFVQSLLAALETGERQAFQSTLEMILTSEIRQDATLANWQQILSAITPDILTSLPQPIAQKAVGLLEQARLMVSERQRRQEGIKRLQAERQAFALHHIGQELITTFDLDTLAELVKTRFPELGIPGCSVVLFDNPADSISVSSRPVAEKRLHVLTGYGAGFPTGKPAITPCQPVDEHLTNLKAAGTLIVEPLDFQDQHLGYIVFEIGPLDGMLYEKLRSYLSSAIKGALLFQRSESLFRQEMAARQKAEEADRLKTTLLANVSHDLRTPLNVILGYTQSALNDPNPYGRELPGDLIEDLRYVVTNAEHLTRLINDLLDLSRAEINELNLHPEPIDIRTFLLDLFEAMSGTDPQDDVKWLLDLPARMPIIMADPVRLRQIVLNILSNAEEFTDRGTITLGATIEPPFLHIWIRDTGAGIPVKMQEKIFEPFVAANSPSGRRGGIGLGLSITRRLVALHKGIISLESKPGEGSTFHIFLPLPSLEGEAISQKPAGNPVLLYVSGIKTPETIRELCHRAGWGLVRLQNYDDLAGLLADCSPVAVSWDVTDVRPSDWVVIQKLRSNPYLSMLPLLIFDMPANRAANGDLTSVFMKPLHSESLINFIEALGIAGPDSTILVVDDDPQARELYGSLIEDILPDCQLRSAADGVEALHAIKQERPSLIILDLMMPRLDGFGVIRQLRADPKTESIPIIVLSGKVLTPGDIQQLKGERVFLQSKGILSEEELSAIIARVIGEGDSLKPANDIVKIALGFIHQHYSEPITRTEISLAIGVDKDYLGRLFREELGMTVGQYIGRFRIYLARQALRQTDLDIAHIAYQCGFQDAAYFSRLFRKLTGTSPRKYRAQK